LVSGLGGGGILPESSKTSKNIFRFFSFFLHPGDSVRTATTAFVRHKLTPQKDFHSPKDVEKHIFKRTQEAGLLRPAFEFF
jgi:hypothetical protein